MPTGACGINCDICRLHRRRACGSCGAGTSETARVKIETQQRLLGAPCPILACARLSGVSYCLADCGQFPCLNFATPSGAGYPYSRSFLAMQKRRRDELELTGGLIVPPEHWETLAARTNDELQRATGAYRSADGDLLVDVLGRPVRIDLDRKTIETHGEAGWGRPPALLCFVTALYLAQAVNTPLTGIWVSEKDLSCSHFFRGIHQLRTDIIVARFGTAPDDFVRAARALGGVTTRDDGDAAVRLWVFPLIPLKLILWCSDDELTAAVTVLFDGSIEKLLAADAIWALVELVGVELCKAAEPDN